MSHYHIDCYGRSHIGVIEVRVGSDDFSFVYDRKDKQGRVFSHAVFLDHGCDARERSLYSRKQRLWLLQESPIHGYYRDAPLRAEGFSLVLTHRRSLIETGSPFREFSYGTSWLGRDGFSEPCPKSKLLSFIGSLRHGDDNGYALRKAVALRLMNDPNCECFGYGIREIQGKLQGLSDYRFSVAMENTQEDWYFSEKLIDCLLSDTIPIYWGCPSIGRMFDERGLIRFNNLDELETILPTLCDERYAAMLPFALENKRIARDHEWDGLDGFYRRLAKEMLERCDLSPVRPGLVKRLTMKLGIGR